MTDTRQALAALLPCPFCGNSDGLAVANENPHDLSGGYFIACPSCDASTGLRFACGEDPTPLLIEQWNRRAALSAQPVAGAVADDEAEFTGANFDRRTDVIGLVQASLAAPQPQSAPAPEPICQPNGLMFDALGEPRTRYVRVSLHGSHCVMHPSEGDTYLKDARENGDESPYVADNVWLSEREFDNLGEFDGF